MSRWDDEELKFVHPNKSIECYDCIFKASGKHGFENAYCMKYPRPKGDIQLTLNAGKPGEILFNNAHCKYYTKDTRLSEIEDIK